MPGIASFAFVPHFVVLVLLGTLRIGEALVPGPWAIGCLNPNSLLGKADQITCLPDGIYAVSESSLTAPGVERFRRELKSKDSEYRFCSGHPAPHRSNHSIGGKPVGSGFISRCPSRSIDSGWSELYKSSRLCAAKFFQDQCWITGGTAYGYASGAITSAVCEATDRLLQELTQQIVFNSRGPRFIAGDWNQELEKLQEPRIWERHGFVEIQDFALLKFGIQPAVTCKGSTRKDFVYLSPELLERVIAVKLDATLFSDHSVLFAVLKDTGVPERSLTWRIPRPFQWTPQLIEAVQTSDTSFSVADKHPTIAYRMICQKFEADVQAQMQSFANWRGSTSSAWARPDAPSHLSSQRACTGQT